MKSTARNWGKDHELCPSDTRRT